MAMATQTRGARGPLGAALLLLLALEWRLAAAARRSAQPPPRGAASRCSQSALSGVQFDASATPAAATPSDLPFCQQFRHATCCNRTHARAILRAAAPYYTDDVGGACRDLAGAVLCASCHPLVATGAHDAVCPSLCHRWFDACRAAMFTADASALAPCAPDSLLCARLDSFVRSGDEMCRMAGVRVAPPPPPAAEESLEALLSAARRAPPAASVRQCYDGSVPLPKPPPPPPAPAARVKRTVQKSLSWLRANWREVAFGLVAVAVAATWLRSFLRPVPKSAQEALLEQLRAARVQRFQSPMPAAAAT